MRSHKKVSGIWRGTYRYDPSELAPPRDPVGFTLTLRQGWFGRFTGSVEEDAARGMPGVGTVEGRFSYPAIKFIKQMPIGYVATRDGGRETFREAFRKFGITLEQEVPHPPILYVGTFSDMTHAHGTWAIPPHPVPLDDSRILRLPGGTGGWDLEAA
jgi:hypothetical protein